MCVGVVVDGLQIFIEHCFLSSHPSLFLCAQFREKEERISQLEYDLEGSQAELQSRLHHISEMEETIRDLQSEVAKMKDQTAAALNEVRSYLETGFSDLS